MESTIGKRIQQLREAKELSVADFAKAAGVKPTAIYGIEREDNKPSFDVLQRLRQHFDDLNGDWLLDGIGPMLRKLTPASTQSNDTAEPAAVVPSLDTIPAKKLAPQMQVVRPTYEELLAENASLHKRLDEKDGIILDLKTDKGQLWQQNTRLIELGKTDASVDTATPADLFGWTAAPHRQVNGYVRYDSQPSACAHYDLATGRRVADVQVAKAA